MVIAVCRLEVDILPTKIAGECQTDGNLDLPMTNLLALIVILGTVAKGCSYGCADIPLLGQTALPKRLHYAAIHRIGLSHPLVLRYPQVALNKRATGTAAADVCFDPTGRVISVSVLTAPDVSIQESLEQALGDLRVGKPPPRWSPRGVAVRWVFYYVITDGRHFVIDTSRPLLLSETEALGRAFQRP